MHVRVTRSFVLRGIKRCDRRKQRPEKKKAQRASSMTDHQKDHVLRAIERGKIQLLSLATPNGVKVAAALEELGLAYDAITVDIRNNEQFAPEFLAVSPNNKIPAIVDPRVPMTIQYKHHNNVVSTVQVEFQGSDHPQNLTRTADGWETVTYLAPGTHHFKFIVDGTSLIDPTLPTTHDDQHKLLANQITVTGEPLKLFESGAILLHLAETSGKLLPQDWYRRKETITWLFFQMAGVGPMFGQYGHFARYAKEKIPYAIQRYETEAKRLLGVLEKQLGTKQYIIGSEYTIADIATWPWVNTLELHYGNTEILKEFPITDRWRKRCMARPASEKAMTVTAIVAKQ